jgi:hypothetical protein
MQECFNVSFTVCIIRLVAQFSLSVASHTILNVAGRQRSRAVTNTHIACQNGAVKINLLCHRHSFVLTGHVLIVLYIWQRVMVSAKGHIFWTL